MAHIVREPTDTPAGLDLFTVLGAFGGGGFGLGTEVTVTGGFGDQGFGFGRLFAALAGATSDELPFYDGGDPLLSFNWPYNVPPPSSFIQDEEHPEPEYFERYGPIHRIAELSPACGTADFSWTLTPEMFPTDGAGVGLYFDIYQFDGVDPPGNSFSYDPPHQGYLSVIDGPVIVNYSRDGGSISSNTGSGNLPANFGPAEIAPPVVLTGQFAAPSPCYIVSLVVAQEFPAFTQAALKSSLPKLILCTPAAEIRIGQSSAGQRALEMPVAGGRKMMESKLQPIETV